MVTLVALAVISDVHGNALALEAVLNDIRRYAPDVVVTLGDQVWGQVDPLGAYELPASLDAVEVRGNNDEKLFLGAGRLSEFEKRYAVWLSKRVPSAALERLNSLPLTASVADGRVAAAHGTPASAWENLLWRLDADGLVPRSGEEVRQDLGGVDDTCLLISSRLVRAERSIGHIRLTATILPYAGPFFSILDKFCVEMRKPLASNARICRRSRAAWCNGGEDD